MQSPSPDEAPLNLKSALIRSVKPVAAGVIAGALIGLVISQVVPQRWTAKVPIQIGRVSMPDGRSAKDQLIENPLTTVERFNSPTSRIGVLQALGLPLPDSGNKSSDLIFESMRAMSGGNADLVTVQTSAYSREEVSTTLAAVAKVLIGEHQKLYELTVSNLRRNRESAEAKLAAAERDYARANGSLESRVMNSQGKGALNNAGDILIANVATLGNAQILDLRKQVADYDDSLNPIRTYPTRIVGQIYVPARPSTPSVLMMIAVGAMVGLLVGGGFFIFTLSARD